METFQAKYVLGCDGGRSKTRSCIGIEMDRKYSGTYFIIGDCTFEEPLPTGSEKQIDLFSTPMGLGILFPLPGKNKVRIFFQAPPGVKSRHDLKLDRAFYEKLLKERTGMDFVVKELNDWQSVFEISHGTSSGYRVGRVFLSGDAAHVHSPVGGQGMCFGIMDANAFASKLAWAKRCAARYPGDEGKASVGTRRGSRPGYNGTHDDELGRPEGPRPVHALPVPDLRY